MDSPQTVAEVRDESPPKALSPRHRIEYRSRHSLHELLTLYDAGRGLLTRRNHERWRDTFSLSVAAGGVFTGSLDGSTGLMALFWRTDNPVVNIEHIIPAPCEDGRYVYVCWLWNSFGVRGLTALKAHLFRSFPGAKFVAHHDQRAKVKGKARSEVERGRGTNRIVVHPLTGAGAEEVEKLLAERNGHGRG